MSVGIVAQFGGGGRSHISWICAPGLCYLCREDKHLGSKYHKILTAFDAPSQHVNASHAERTIWQGASLLTLFEAENRPHQCFVFKQILFTSSCCNVFTLSPFHILLCHRFTFYCFIYWCLALHEHSRDCFPVHVVWYVHSITCNGF